MRACARTHTLRCYTYQDEVSRNNTLVNHPGFVFAISILRSSAFSRTAKTHTRQRVGMGSFTLMNHPGVLGQCSSRSSTHTHTHTHTQRGGGINPNQLACIQPFLRQTLVQSPELLLPPAAQIWGTLTTNPTENS